MDYSQVLETIKAAFPGAILEESLFCGDMTIYVSKDSFLDLMHFLQDNKKLHYDLLIDIVGIDRLPRSPRFDIAYILLSMDDFRRLIIKLKIDEGEDVPSVVNIWKAADWPEREVFDLLGIQFKGHPDLRRILTWDNFEGHPLRKDFPLLGKDFDKRFDPDTIVVK